jgi:type I restriction enzyme S subunit
MLEDLKVYRSAIISEAVTKGLDKNVEMKDSGIERFPYINRHWRTIKLKYISTIKSGKLLANSELSENGLYEVYGGNGFMGYTSEFNTESPAIVIGRVGALCGNVHLIDSSKWVTDNALVLNIIDDKISYEYLYFYLDAFDLNTLNSSNAQPLITGTKVLDVLMPLPSLDEQQRIAEKIKVKILVIDELINKFNEQISDLKSYKSSLITEAVTGKIDLRDWKK